LTFWQAILLALLPSLSSIVINIIFYKGFESHIEYKLQNSLMLLKKRFDIVNDFYEKYLKFKNKFYEVLDPNQFTNDRTNINDKIKQGAKLGYELFELIEKNKIYLGKSVVKEIDGLIRITSETWEKLLRDVVRYQAREGDITDEQKNEWVQQWNLLKSNLDTIEKKIREKLSELLNINER